MDNIFSLPRHCTAAVAAGVMAVLAVAASPAAAAQCKAGDLAGAWAAAFHEIDRSPKTITVIAIDVDAKGRYGDGAESLFPAGKIYKILSGSLSVSANCTVSGKWEERKPSSSVILAFRVRGTLDPKNGHMRLLSNLLPDEPLDLYRLYQ